MAQITAITPQAKDKNRVNVYVDGRFYCGMRLETVLSCRLKEGDEVDIGRLDEIQLENERAQALDKALTHLSASMKTQKQMMDFLKKKGYVDSVCEYVLEKLRGYGFVDDVQYCVQFAETAGKRMGARRIASELKMRGADEESIERALAGLTEEAETAKAVAKKYMKNRAYDRETLTKAYRHLLGKGVDYEPANEALASLGAESEEE